MGLFMDMIEGSSERFKKRLAAERRFKLYGQFAIALAIIALATLLFSVLSQSFGAFQQYNVKLPLSISSQKLDPDGYIVKNPVALKNRTAVMSDMMFEGLSAELGYGPATRMSTPEERKQIRAFLTPLVSGEVLDKLIKNPKLFDTSHTYSVPLSDDLDLYLKGATTRTAKVSGAVSAMNPMTDGTFIFSWTSAQKSRQAKEMITSHLESRRADVERQIISQSLSLDKAYAEKQIAEDHLTRMAGIGSDDIAKQLNETLRGNSAEHIQLAKALGAYDMGSSMQQEELKAALERYFKKEMKERQKDTKTLLARAKNYHNKADARDKREAQDAKTKREEALLAGYSALNAYFRLYQLEQLRAIPDQRLKATAITGEDPAQFGKLAFSLSAVNTPSSSVSQAAGELIEARRTILMHQQAQLELILDQFEDFSSSALSYDNSEGDRHFANAKNLGQLRTTLAQRIERFELSINGLTQQLNEVSAPDFSDGDALQLLGSDIGGGHARAYELGAFQVDPDYARIAKASQSALYTQRARAAENDIKSLEASLEGLQTVEEEIPVWPDTTFHADQSYLALDNSFPTALVFIETNAYKVIAVNDAHFKATPLGYTDPAITDTEKAKLLLVYKPQAERNVSDLEISWVTRLTNNNIIKSGFRTRLFTHADSNEPELAGALGAIVGTFFTMMVTMLLAAPLGVLAAIYLEEFAPKNRLTDFIEVNTNNLAAVPSIVFGLLGASVFIGFFGMPRSAPLVGGLVLSLMTLPTIIIASRASLKAVPPSIREAALGLGASRMQAVFHHVLPMATPGMLTGTIIGMARAIGETAPLLLIGMVAFIADTPKSLFDSATVMPVLIYQWSTRAFRAWEPLTAASILILLVFLLAMNILAVYLRSRYERRW